MSMMTMTETEKFIEQFAKHPHYKAPEAINCMRNHGKRKLL